MTKNFLGLTEACKYLGISRQAVHHAIKIGRIHAVRDQETNEYIIEQEQLDNYKASKHQRQLTTMHNGKQAYSHDLLSLASVERLSQIPRNHWYYAIYNGLIPFEKVGAQYIFRLKDIEEYTAKFWQDRGKENIKIG